MTRTERSYEEGCLAAHALDLTGDRWAILVLRELMLGPRRFSDLRAGLPGLSANILTQRLEALERAGLLGRIARPVPAKGFDYALLPAGEAFWPVMRELCRFAVQVPGHDPQKFISPTALMLSMKAMCDCHHAGAHGVEMRIGAEHFTIRTRPGDFAVTRGADPGAGLRFGSENGNAMAMAVYGPMPLSMTSAGLIGFEGDPAAGQSFLDLFALRVPPAM